MGRTTATSRAFAEPVVEGFEARRLLSGVMETPSPAVTAPAGDVPIEFVTDLAFDHLDRNADIEYHAQDRIGDGRHEHPGRRRKHALHGRHLSSAVLAVVADDSEVVSAGATQARKH